MNAPARRLPEILGERVHALSHASRAAPRLYRAARGAGATVPAAAGLLGWSAVVLLVVAPRAAGVRGRQNAVRHFVWQALLAARYGDDVARAVARAQEAGSPDRADSSVDQHNNAVAQAYGRTHAEQLRGRSTPAVLSDLLAAGLEAFAAGELRA